MPETWKSRAERVPEEKKGLNYILEFVLDLGENSPLSLALENVGITSPLDLISLSYENIEDLVYNEVEEGTEKKIPKHNCMCLHIFKYWVNADLSYQRINFLKREWDKIRFEDFEDYRLQIKIDKVFLKSMPPSPPPSDTPTVATLCATSTRTWLSPARFSKKTVKRDSSLYPFMTDPSQWGSFNHEFCAIARSQKVEQVIDTHYAPHSSEEKDLFNEQQAFIYSVLIKSLKFDQGQKIVRANKGNVQKIYSQLTKEMETSTRTALADDNQQIICQSGVCSAGYPAPINSCDDKWGDGESKPHEFISTRIDYLSTDNDTADDSELSFSSDMALIHFDDLIECTFPIKESSKEGEKMTVVNLLYDHKQHVTSDPRHLQFQVKRNGSNYEDIIAYNDIWISESQRFYEYVPVYVDDLAMVLRDPQAFVEIFKKKKGFHFKGIGEITYHLGTDFDRDKVNTLCMSPKKYIVQMTYNFVQIFVKGSSPTCLSALEKKDHPELDESEFLDVEVNQHYQSLDSSLQWDISLERFDTQCAEILMTKFGAASHQGHLQRLKSIYRYLFFFKDAKLIFRARPPNYSDVLDFVYDWSSVYGEDKESLPTNYPSPKISSIPTWNSIHQQPGNLEKLNDLTNHLHI